jgi:hypothetical protein
MLRFSSIALRLLLPGFGVLMSLVIIECGWRIASSAERTRWSDRPTSYFRPPGSKTFQDYPYEEAKPDGTFRIAVVGDSFSFGPFLQIEDTFPKRLERILSMNRKQSAAEVLNFGVPGFSTYHEIAITRTALSYAPDLLILQITLNDIAVEPLRSSQLTGEYDFSPYSPPPIIARLLNHWRSLDFILRRVHDAELNKRHKKYYTNLYQNQESYRQFSNSLKEISKLAHARETPLVAVLFPLFGDSLDDTYPFRSIHKKIGQTLSKLSIPTLDLFESYRNIPPERLQVKPGKDTHPNEIAHRIAAEQIHQWLSHSAHIPEDLHVRKMPVRRYKHMQ